MELRFTSRLARATAAVLADAILASEDVGTITASLRGTIEVEPMGTEEEDDVEISVWLSVEDPKPRHKPRGPL